MLVGNPEDTKHSRAYAAIAASFACWWVSMFCFPEIRPWFVGEEWAKRDFLFILPLDLVAIGLASREAIRLRKGQSETPWGSVVAATAVLAGTAISIFLAVKSPESVLGLYAMMLASTWVLGIEVARRKTSIVWGPFRFGKAAPSSRRERTLQVIRQVAGMWTVFLALIPMLAFGAEQVFGWDARRFPFPLQVYVGAAAFIALGTLGLRSALAMIDHGEGTPLPIAGTNQLVICGPYAWIRNPMAFSSIGQGLAIGLSTGSPLIVTYALCGGILWDFCIRPLEERYLESEFGEDYIRYRDAVPCWRFRTKPFQP